VVGVGAGAIRAWGLAAGVTLAVVLAAGAGTPASARLPARLIIACAPEVKCTDSGQGLHRLDVGASYTLQLPIGEPISASRSKRRAIERALRFRTREIRPQESDAVLFYVNVATFPSSPVGGFIGTRALRIANVPRHTAPIACTLELTACSDAPLAALGVSPERGAKMCARTFRRLRRRLGIIGVETPQVSFAVDTCAKPKPPKTTTTSSTRTTTTRTTTSTSTTTIP